MPYSIGFCDQPWGLRSLKPARPLKQESWYSDRVVAKARVWARVRTDLTTAKNARSKIMVCSGRLPESYVCSCHIFVKLFEAHFTLSIFCFFVKWWLKVSYCDLDSWEEGFSQGCLQYVPHSTTQILGQHACDGYISKILSRPFNPTSGWWTNAPIIGVPEVSMYVGLVQLCSSLTREVQGGPT